MSQADVLDTPPLFIVQQQRTLVDKEMAVATLDEVEAQLRAIISNLYMLIVQAHDYQGSGTQNAIKTEIKNLMGNLTTLSRTSQRLPTHLPLEIIQYVENARNPDVYTREFVELIMTYNQQLKGRSAAFAQFRDILGREIASAIPDIRDDVRKVVEASGGQID